MSDYQKIAGGHDGSGHQSRDKSRGTRPAAIGIHPETAGGLIVDHPLRAGCGRGASHEMLSSQCPRRPDIAEQGTWQFQMIRAVVKISDHCRVFGTWVLEDERVRARTAGQRIIIRYDQRVVAVTAIDMILPQPAVERAIAAPASQSPL